MTTYFEEISKQAENSSLDAQKAEWMKMGVLEENISIEVGSATDSIIFETYQSNLKMLPNSLDAPEIL